MSGMKDKRTQDLQEFFTDPTDRRLAEILSPLRETVVPDEGFSLRVRRALPRRDISLWVILLAVLPGGCAAVGIVGWQQTLEFFGAFRDFFVSMFDMRQPSRMSWISVAAFVVVLGFVLYAFLDTDAYQSQPGWD